MNKREVAILACRAFALYLIFWLVIQLEVVSYVWATARGSELSAQRYPLILIPFATAVVLAILVWRKAGWLADRMVAGIPETEASATTLTAADLQVVAFTVVGLVLLVRTIPRAATVLRRPAEIAYLVSWLIQLALGVWLLLGSRGIVCVLRKIRTAGIRSSDETA